MLLFGIILVMMAVSAIITNQQTKKASQQEEIASSIAQGANELSYLGNDYLIYRESQQLKRWQSRFASFSSQVAGLRADRPEQQALVANIRANQGRLKEVFDSVVSAPGGPPQNRSTTLDPAFLQVSWSRIAVQSQGLVSDASRLSLLLHQRIDQLRKTRTMLIYVMVGLLGAFLLVSYMLTYRRILKSLGTLQAGTTVIGSGNLDLVIEEKKNDEIGDLSRAFNRMTADLKGVTASKSELEQEIAEREQVEQALRESEAQLRAILENLAEGVAVSDLDGRFLYWNRACLDMHGFSSLEECQRRLPDFGGIFELSSVDNTVLSVNSWPLSRILRGEHLRDLEIRIRRHNTDWQRMFSYGGTLARDMDGKPLLAVVTVADITERKQGEEELQQRTIKLQQLTETLEQRVRERTAELAKANEALRQLSIRLLSAQEEERKRVAGELHDSIGACLTGIKFKVESSLQQMGKTQNHMTESLKTIIPVIQEGIEDCRRMQQDLRPSMLDDLGLLPTLSWFCRRYQTIYMGIKVALEQTLEERDIPNSLKIVIYRVTQEGMNNIAKHSKADLVHLFLRRMDGRIELILEDNGQGFDLKKVLGSESTKRGLGLTSMRERIELSGGSFTIESAEGKGTIIRALWPL
jgi:PAS domain S-box-containing protein